jgi:hypothetical protein
MIPETEVSSSSRGRHPRPLVLGGLSSSEQIAMLELFSGWSPAGLSERQGGLERGFFSHFKACFSGIYYRCFQYRPAHKEQLKGECTGGDWLQVAIRKRPWETF